MLDWFQTDDMSSTNNDKKLILPSEYLKIIKSLGYEKKKRTVEFSMLERSIIRIILKNDTIDQWQVQ